MLTVTGSLVALGLAGCLGEDEDDEGENGDDEKTNENGNGNETESGDLEIEAFDVLRDEDDSIAASIHGDHWHDGPLEVPRGDTRSLGAYAEDEDGEEIEFGDEYELAVEVADGAEDGIVESDPTGDDHGDRVHLSGVEDGRTTVVFQIRVDEDVVYETPALEVAVGDTEGDTGDEHERDEHEHDGEEHGHADENHEHDGEEHDH